MSPVLEIDGLCVRRGNAVMLRDVSWTVMRGQHWVILGPNGCGKTSLLKSVTGYLSPTTGTVSVLGRTYGRSDWRELRLSVGIVTKPRWIRS
jgi:iron complex transport system ATP-binding protein